MKEKHLLTGKGESIQCSRLMASHTLAVPRFNRRKSVSPALERLPGTVSWSLAMPGRVSGSFQQRPEAGSGGTKPQQTKAAISQVNLFLQNSVPSPPSPRVCMFGAGVGIHIPHGAVLDGHAVNWAHWSMSTSLYVSGLSLTYESGLCVFLACSEGAYDWVVQRSPSQGSSGKALGCLKELEAGLPQRVLV